MRHSFTRGLRYAAIFMVVSAVMGLLYGLFGGLIWRPALFSVTTVGLFAVINFVVACVLGLPILIARFFGWQPVWFGRYFMYSLAFTVVFFPVFVAIELLPAGPF